MASIDLLTKVVPQKTILQGSGGFTATAGQRIRLRITGGGPIVDIIDETVPEGKVWRVRVELVATEENA